jgi:NADH-quinone oxidoreductase subunit C
VVQGSTTPEPEEEPTADGDGAEESPLDAVERGPRSTEPEPGPSMPENLGRAHPSVVALRETFPEMEIHHEVTAGDRHLVLVPAGHVHPVLQWLRDDPDHRYDLLRDVTAVDYGGGRPLQVVYQLFSIPHRRSLTVKCQLPVSALEVESVADLWKAANWLEREVYDLFGIEFEGHPDLRRILMPENYAEGHPLRKDFPLRGRFSRAEQTRRALSQDPEDYYIPSEFGVGREPQTAAGTPATRPDFASEAEDDRGGVEGSA